MNLCGGSALRRSCHDPPIVVNSVRRVIPYPSFPMRRSAESAKVESAADHGQGGTWAGSSRRFLTSNQTPAMAMIDETKKPPVVTRGSTGEEGPLSPNRMARDGRPS